MKVLQINAVYGISSTGRVTMELDRALQQQGHQSLVATTKTNCQRDGLYIIGNKRDWKLHALCSRVFGLQGYYSAAATKQLINYIEREKPDIIHLGNLHANYINLPTLFRYIAQKDIATVITLHDCWFYTGKCTHYTTEQCFKWETGCQNCSKLRTDNKSWLFDRTAKMWGDKRRWYASVPRMAVIGVSDWIVNEAKKSPMFANATIINRIYNWIDLDIFKPVDGTNIREKLGCIEKKIILGVSSSWSNKKGLDKFIELAAHLKENEVIVLVGNMPDVKLPTNIISIPVTADVNELVAYYSVADVFVQLSQEETFGMVVAEALACGTPVITNRNTANPELVASGSGVVLETVCPKEIAEAVEVILAAGKISYTQNCVRFARENFNSARNIPAHISLYEALLQTKEKKDDIHPKCGIDTSVESGYSR